jgi:hypothetical protein
MRACEYDCENARSVSVVLLWPPSNASPATRGPAPDTARNRFAHRPCWRSSCACFLPCSARTRSCIRARCAPPQREPDQDDGPQDQRYPRDQPDQGLDAKDGRCRLGEEDPPLVGLADSIRGLALLPWAANHGIIATGNCHIRGTPPRTKTPPTSRGFRILRLV